LNELVRSTLFTLTIYTIPYPQEHAGLHRSGYPSTATPFLFDRGDTTPVYRLMYQTFSDNLQYRHQTEVSSESRHTLAALETAREGDEPISSPRYRTIWTSGQGSGEAALKWQRVIILIQNGKDKGFTQALIRAGSGSVRTWGNEEHKGHVLEVQIEASPTETIGTIAKNILRQCYTQGSTVPAPHTQHHTLGTSPRHLVWNQRRAPEQILDMEGRGGGETVLTDIYKLEGIKEDATIFVFLPPPDMERTTTREPSADQANHLETPPSSHQIFVQIPDTWSVTRRKPAYILTMPTPTSLETLKGWTEPTPVHPHSCFSYLIWGKNTY